MVDHGPTTAELAKPIPMQGPRTSRDASLLEKSLVAGLLALHAVLLGASMIDESPMTDEPNHLARGVSYFWGPDASLSWAHPPLGNALAALPIVLTAKRVDVGALPSYANADFSEVAVELLEPDYSARRAWFFEGRAMMALASVLLAFYVYRLGVRLYGGAVGLAALGFFVSYPTLIAHGRTLTTDMPVTVAMIMAVGELATFLNGGARRHAATAALALSAALITKFTGLMLIPLAVVTVLLVACLRLGRYRGLSLRRALLAASVFVAVSAVAAIFAIDASYRFEQTGMTVAEVLSQPEPMLGERQKLAGRLLEQKSILPRLPSWLPVPLPYPYVFGVYYVGTHNEGGHSSSFFGENNRRGSPWYFPVMLLIKTPFVLLAALGYAFVVWLKQRGRVRLPTAILCGYAACFLLLAMQARINIGIRHILPILPILALIGGLGAASAWNALQGSRYRRPLVALAAAGSVLGLASTFPDYISDFNILVGGRSGGQKISIVGEEWGQDTQRVARALRQRGVTTIPYTGNSRLARLELAYGGVTSESLTCDQSLPSDTYYAVRARDRTRKRCHLWSSRRKPLFDIHGHVFVYRAE